MYTKFACNSNHSSIFYIFRTTALLYYVTIRKNAKSHVGKKKQVYISVLYINHKRFISWSKLTCQHFSAALGHFHKIFFLTSSFWFFFSFSQKKIEKKIVWTREKISQHVLKQDASLLLFLKTNSQVNKCVHPISLQNYTILLSVN